MQIKGIPYQVSAPVSFEIKSVDATQRLIEGYGSVFNVRDHQRDVVVPGAFKKTLKDRRKPVIGMREHRSVIGTVEAKEDGHGLFCRYKVSETPLGDETLTLAADGALPDQSIGYSVVREKNSTFEGKPSNLLQEMVLYECSILPFGANDSTSITVVKEMTELLDEFARKGDLTADEVRQAEDFIRRAEQLQPIYARAAAALGESKALDDLEELIWKLPRAIEILTTDWNQEADRAREVVQRAVDEMARSIEQLQPLMASAPGATDSTEPLMMGDAPEALKDQAKPTQGDEGDDVAGLQALLEKARAAVSESATTKEKTAHA